MADSTVSQPLVQFEQLLEQLRAAQAPGPIARQALETAQDQLDAQFASTPIRTLVANRAQAVDTVLSAAWHFFNLHDETDLALIAVGGYGRGELHPHSDVDLLILSDNPASTASQSKLESFIAFLWDIGLEIGHSVRTLNECVELADNDITIATNIMEARTLCGGDNILEALTERTSPDKIWSSKAFYKAKWDEQQQRHRKANFTEYNLEPDLKKDPGGLRDVQMVGWVAKRHFGVNSLAELVDVGYLTQDEFDVMEKCQDFLWQVRWLLHRVTGRSENRLLFDHQKQVAKEFGFEDDQASLGVEQLMQRYYRAALALSVLNELLLQLFDENILRSDEKETITPINRRFHIHNDYLEAVDDDVFKRFPSALLEAFVILGQNPDLKGIRASTIRLIIEERHSVDEKYRHDSRNTSLFMELLRVPHGLHIQLRRMSRYGILGRYLPEFGGITGMMQYDLFHIYTVDAHTLRVVKNMRRMRYESTRKEIPLAHEVFYRLPKPEVLYIAGLYHDIAKGRGGDHSELGADDAIAFCERHGLSRWDAKMVAWLVRSHLIMSVTAQRKDISDPDVVHEFAQQVGDMVHLDYLFALTVADINATNPKLWNSWRASLMRQLYRDTKRLLRRGLNNRVDRQDWIDETRQAAQSLLNQSKFSKTEIDELWAGVGEEYFLRENAADIAWHTEAILSRQTPDEPIVLIRESSATKHEDGTQIFIYTPDTDNLFAATTAAIDELGLTILDARIITSADGFSLDTYIVLDENNVPIGDDQDRINAIQKSLTQTLKDSNNFPEIMQRRMPRQHKHFNVPTQAIISTDPFNEHSIVEVETLDQPGLLAKIGAIFSEFDLTVHNARIATLGEKVEDVFFVSDKQGNPLSDPELCQRLQQRLKDEFNRPANNDKASITL